MIYDFMCSAILVRMLSHTISDTDPYDLHLSTTHRCSTARSLQLWVSSLSQAQRSDPQRTPYQHLSSHPLPHQRTLPQPPTPYLPHSLGEPLRRLDSSRACPARRLSRVQHLRAPPWRRAIRSDCTDDITHPRSHLVDTRGWLDLLRRRAPRLVATDRRGARRQKTRYPASRCARPHDHDHAAPRTFLLFVIALFLTFTPLSRPPLPQPQPSTS